jgi:Protein of unknown function (DUF2867)
MKLPNSVHESHPWVIGRIAPDFKLLDAWAVPVEGGPDEFDSFLEVMASIDPAAAESALSRALFSLRLRLGAWLGLDDATSERPIPGCTETTLSDRLSEGLHGSATGPATNDTMQRARFVPLYRTNDEWAAEVSNATVHGVLQLAWVEQGEGRFRGQMGVYVKPRGKLGEAYLLLIESFRHFIVYPALMRQIGRARDARSSAKR